MCLGDVIHWLVDLDLSIPPNEQVKACGRCRNHAAHNFRLIEAIPHASGAEPIAIYGAWKAKQPPAPPRKVVELWGEYRVDPDNFVPAVTKVLDIVHSAGPKLRWSVKLAGWDQTPVTNMSSKEITLPNYFQSPHALGRTHEEILDAMTGAAMHEAGHAAYDTAETIIESQRRLRHRPDESPYASSMCLNVVCDYNLERKVLERYPAFRHYFTECHRWSVRDSLPNLVKALADPDAEDKLVVRLGVLVWEMLGPGDLERAGATLTPKLQWITRKCFDILKYAYTRGYLNTEPGKLRTSRALYELIKIANPVGAPPNVVQVPQPPLPPGPPVTCGFPGQPSQNQQGQPGGQQGQPGDPDEDDDDAQQPGQGGWTQAQQNPEDYDDWDPDAANDELDRLQAEQDAEDADNDGSGTSDSDGDQDDRGSTDRDTDAGNTEDAAEDQEGSDQGSGGDQEKEGSQGSGDQGVAPTLPGTDPGEDGSQDGDGQPGSDSSTESSDTPPEDSQGQGHLAGDPDQPGNPDNTDAEDGDARSLTPSSGSSQGGKSGSEIPDPFDGSGDLKDDPNKRKNSSRDALDDLATENKGKDQIQQNRWDAGDIRDQSFDAAHRNQIEKLQKVPAIIPGQFPEGEEHLWPIAHQYRTKRLSPVISRLKKILRFRNVDHGGQLTGRRSGTLTRRHVNRLATLGSDKVFHSKRPDATPKVRIGLVVDESESMRGPRDEAAKDATTALQQALHGIKGVKLWVWGYSMSSSYRGLQRQHGPTMRLYVDPFHKSDPTSLETSSMFGGTPTGECMDYAADQIMKGSTPDEKKVIFVITDGEAGGYVSTGTAVRKWWGKVTFVHIGIGQTQDPAIPFYVGPVTNIAILPDLLSESVSDILH